MPQPVNSLQHAQWDMCSQCGFWYPMGSLVKQKGLLVCLKANTCWDNLEVEERPFVIAQVLGPTAEVEGADMRVIDRGFFEDFEFVQR